MDQNLKSVMEKKVNRTIENLKKHNINGYHVESPEQALNLVKTLVAEGSTVSVGGSMTLFETGLIDHLRSGRYDFWDRYEEGLTPNDIRKLYQKSFMADAYFSSANAITEDGWIVNVDGVGNRVAAMIYGPEKVIVVAGTNKIVKNTDEAHARIKASAAPANVARLSRNTPCAVTGYCMDCKSEERICNAYTTVGRQVDPNRMHVIFIDGNFGY